MSGISLKIKSCVKFLFGEVCFQCAGPKLNKIENAICSHRTCAGTEMNDAAVRGKANLARYKAVRV